MEEIKKQHFMGLLRFAICFQLVLICTCLTNETTNSQSFPWNKMRLPTYVVPNHYELSIHPNLTTLNFTGSVRISIDVKQDTSYIVLHNKGLEITKATILSEDRTETDSEQLLTVLEHQTHEQIALLPPHQLCGPKKYQLYIEFQADLSDGFDGFYKSTYRTQDGDKR